MQVKDQVFQTIEINFPPKRIVSLVPSQTELLYDLGLENQVVGITKFCVRPPHWIKEKLKVGGTKNVSIQKVIDLNPDLVLANKEENNKEDIDRLSQTIPVWTSQVSNVQDAFYMIDQIGMICDRQLEATAMTQKIQHEIRHFVQFRKSILPTPLKICYLIWKAPWMSVGKDTFIHEMLELAGFENIFSDKIRYPTTSLDEIRQRGPDWIFLSSEPYPFNEKHKDLFKDFNSIIVDGEPFSWYGSRMLYSFKYFCRLIDQIQTTTP
ncbi:MAG: ABC transporter substrate-binding protein [Saprospiraceae bacterium]|nr:ABC transporter substrate-binding protein [Saprospiraceae bacterium]